MDSGKTARTYAIFQTISGRYDRMNDLISLFQHRRWKRALTAEVSGRRPLHILDLCCGTGDISLALARANPAARVVGLDFSQEMLKVARGRLAGEGLSNLSFVQGDAMALPFSDGSFDCAVISFGLRNLPDYEAALREMARVVKPAGGVWCLDSFYPEAPLIRPFYRLYFKHFVTLLGGVVAGRRAEYRWLYDSTERFLSKEALLRLFEHCGLEDCTCRPHLFGAAARHRGTKPTGA